MYLCHRITIYLQMIMTYKRSIIIVALACIGLTAWGQNSYIVKTKGARKLATITNSATGEQTTVEEQPHDFVTDNFKFYSLCDWKEGMKFMVIPSEYDLVVNTFCDSLTNKEVSSLRLKYKIMLYKGHYDTPEGHARISFYCQDDKKTYYYEIPSGSFDDYCYGKTGVPALAYLGDVDIARTLLMGATMYTKAPTYKIDTEANGDGFQEVDVPLKSQVKVVAIGVGTRSFPVKIIVDDKDGKEFYQNVAISRTNCGMRDDEFQGVVGRNTFQGAFDYNGGDKVAVSPEFAKYIGKRVYTKYMTTMENDKGTKVRVSKYSTFLITDIKEQGASRYVLMTLRGTTSGKEYTKKVTFTNDNVAGDIDGTHEDYFPYLFNYGNGKTAKSKRRGRVSSKGDKHHRSVMVDKTPDFMKDM